MLRRLLCRSGVAALLVVTVGVVVPAALAVAASAQSPAAGAPDQASALRAARQLGERVEALSERTEFSQVFAEPSGRLTYEATAVPQRVRRTDGSWADIDLRLSRGPDGLLRPAASLADVRFSGGGRTPLVTLVRGGKTLSVQWPVGPLPAPSVAGDAATYANVLPDVDLVVRATHTGFTHVLVVKTAQAATSSAVRELRFGLGGDARTVQMPDGTLQASAGGLLLARAAAPMMWDSAASTGTRTAYGPAEDSSASDHTGPGDGAQVVDLDTEIDGGELVMRPDRAFLEKDARFPVFIDPPWSTGKTRWAYATNNNTNNSDTSRARVGADPDSGKLYRSFFEFPTTAIKGKHVESAYVQMVLDHSASCTDTWTHLYHSSVISTPRTPWSTNLISRVAAAASHANEGNGCSDSPQPDMTVNFTGGDVTALVGTTASKGTNNLTVGFSAGNETGAYETDTSRWKKFFPDKAKLIADVDAKPAKPTGLQVNGIACTTAGVSVGVTNPYFSAILPDADGTAQNLSATWEFVRAPVGGTMTALTAPPKTSATANTRGISGRVSAPTGNRYAFRVRGTDPAPYSITSPWSDYCYFTVDTAAPPLTITEVSRPAGPGKPGTYRLSSTATDVATFRYGWTEAVTKQIAASTDATIPGKSATVTVTAPSYGVNVLYGQAVDSTGNKGYGSAEFVVDSPSPEIASWGLETYAGVDQASSLADRRPGAAGDTPLTETNLGWADDVRLIGGRTAAFGGNTQLSTAGPVLDTTRSFSVAAWVRPSAVPTADLGVATQDSTATQGFGLGTRLVGSPLTPRWSFAMKDTAVQSSLTRAAYAATPIGSVDVGRWTHLAGVFDAAAQQIRLYVNGVLTAEVDRPVAPWTAAGKFGVGRYVTNGVVGNWFTGQIADVRVFDRTLVNDDFTGTVATGDHSAGRDEPGAFNPTPLARWNFETAVPCYEANIPDTCQAPGGPAADTMPWNRRLLLTPGTTVGPGNGSQGLAFDDVHFVEDAADPHFGESTAEHGTSQRDIAATGQPAQWQDGPVLRTDQPFTVSVWWQPGRLDRPMTAVAQRGSKQSSFALGIRPSTVGGVTGARVEVLTTSVDADTNETYARLAAPVVLDTDDTTHWTHVVLVYDPTSAVKMRLFVSGELAAEGPGTLWHAGGALTVGAAWSTPAATTGWQEQWHGGIDDLAVYQGAMTPGQVAILHQQQPDL